MNDPKKMMSPEEDTGKIRDLNASLKKATFHHEVRDGIFMYRFDNLNREVFIQWVEHFRAFQDKFPHALRILYDYRGSGPPSRFLSDRVPAIMAEFDIPDDTRLAFVVDDNLNGRFTRAALAKLPKSMGETRSFVNINPALQWLREGLETADAHSADAESD